MANGPTQHEKLDKITDVVTDVRIELGKIGVHLDNAEKERTEMKDDIKDNSKMKRISNLWDGINSLAIGIGTYFGIKQ